MVLLVDLELLAEQVVALLVDLLVVLVVGAGVDWAELSVPANRFLAATVTLTSK